MVIDKVIEQVYRHRRRVDQMQRGGNICLAIYMNESFWRQCHREIRGGVSTPALEFAHRGTIFGFPVYMVAETFAGEVRKHPYFEVVNLNG